MFGSAGIGRPTRREGRMHRFASGHFCRAFAVMTAVGAAACSTAHDLGPPTDPGTMAQLDALAAQPGTTADVTPLPGPCPVTSAYAVTAATAEGLTVSTGGGPPELLSYDRVRSLSRVDRLHGARNGALGVGFPSFLFGFIFGKAFDPGPVCMASITGGCPPRPNTTVTGLRIGGVAALIGAAVGGAIGALAGYEDRYFLEPTEIAGAR
jgi:hypothetical protein